ncbi:hypothetical protein NL676_029695 [Syzygium grande]|nr:hypothetical protein NL676_029695 [Syzygium grande]
MGAPSSASSFMTMAAPSPASSFMMTATPSSTKLLVQGEFLLMTCNYGGMSSPLLSEGSHRRSGQGLTRARATLTDMGDDEARARATLAHLGLLLLERAPPRSSIWAMVRLK